MRKSLVALLRVRLIFCILSSGLNYALILPKAFKINLGIIAIERAILIPHVKNSRYSWVSYEAPLKYETTFHQMESGSKMTYIYGNLFVISK